VGLHQYRPVPGGERGLKAYYWRLYYLYHPASSMELACIWFLPSSPMKCASGQPPDILQTSPAPQFKSLPYMHVPICVPQDAVRDLTDLGCHVPVIQNLQALDKVTNTPQVSAATAAALPSERALHPVCLWGVGVTSP
jgi:hypothetical protein